MRSVILEYYQSRHVTGKGPTPMDIGAVWGAIGECNYKGAGGKAGPHKGKGRGKLSPLFKRKEFDEKKSKGVGGKTGPLKGKGSGKLSPFGKGMKGRIKCWNCGQHEHTSSQCTMQLKSILIMQTGHGLKK